MPDEHITAAWTEAIEGLIDGRRAFTSASHALEGLTSAQAVTKLEGWPYSIAEVVAHMLFWQRHDIAAHESGVEPPDPTPADEWPTVAHDDWPRVKDEYLASLERAKELARDPELLRTTLVGDRSTVGLRMVWFAGHHAYHLGQVLVLRRILGAWPVSGADGA